MKGHGKAGGQTRWKGRLPQALTTLLLIWPLLLSQLARHPRRGLDCTLQQLNELQLPAMRQGSSALPLLLLPGKPKAKTASATATVFPWSYVETSWTKQGRRAVPSTAVSSTRRMQGGVRAAEPASKAGSKGQLPARHGPGFVRLCKASLLETGYYYTKRTSAWHMRGVTGARENHANQEQWMGNPDWGCQPAAPWRARNLRAACFQYPRHRLKTYRHRRGSKHESPCAPPPRQAADAAGATSQCSDVAHNHHTAHNLGNPRQPPLGPCTACHSRKARHPKHPDLTAHHKSISVPSGPKSGGCRPARPF